MVIKQSEFADYLQYTSSFVGVPASSYCEQSQPYETSIQTGLENLLWWAQPLFAVIITLLGVAIYLGFKTHNL